MQHVFNKSSKLSNTKPHVHVSTSLFMLCPTVVERVPSFGGPWVNWVMAWIAHDVKMIILRCNETATSRRRWKKGGRVRHGETRSESIWGGEWLTSYPLQLSRSYWSSVDISHHQLHPANVLQAGRDRRRAEQSDGFFMHVIRETEGGEDAAQTADIDNIQRLSWCHSRLCVYRFSPQTECPGRQ